MNTHIISVRSPLFSRASASKLSTSAKEKCTTNEVLSPDSVQEIVVDEDKRDDVGAKQSHIESETVSSNLGRAMLTKMKRSKTIIGRGGQCACEIRTMATASDFPTNDKICELLAIVQEL